MLEKLKGYWSRAIGWLREKIKIYSRPLLMAFGATASVDICVHLSALAVSVAIIPLLSGSALSVVGCMVAAYFAVDFVVDSMLFLYFLNRYRLYRYKGGLPALYVYECEVVD